MTKVLVFGTFDIFHPGHEYFLDQASKKGSELFVVVSRDETVKKVKGKMPVNNEQKRLENIKKIKIVKNAFLGSNTDRLEKLKELNPNIICLGYDQKFMVPELMEAVRKNKWDIEIIRIDSFYADRHKSSILREKMNL